MLKRKFLMLSAVVMSVCLVSAFAAEENTGSQVAGKPADAQYPFIAQVTGSDVYVRSGNSQADYPCTKLNAPAEVTVVDEVYGWAKILPPKGTFSWIYKAYVKVDPTDPTVGVVNAENVRVWAGAENMDSGSSAGLQTMLNNGEVVELLPNQPETGDYYKIKPPTGAHLWISADYLKYERPIQKAQPLVVPPRPETENQVEVPLPSESESAQGRPTFTNIDGQQQQQPVQTPVQPQQQQTQQQTQAAQPQQPQTDQAAQPAQPQPATPEMTARESELLKLAYELSAKLENELKKPLPEQNYAPIKKQLEAIQAREDAGKAAVYAKLLLDRIQRYELAQSITETLQQQERQLEQTRQRIEQAHQDQLSEIPKETHYLYTGTLKPSHVYTSKTGAQRYLLVNEDGKIQCYVVAANPAMENRLEQLVDKTIGINGTIVSDEKSLVALVAVEQTKVFE